MLSVQKSVFFRILAGTTYNEEFELVHVLGGAYFSRRGCVNPASWFPLAAGVRLTQPLSEKLALQSTESNLIP